MGRGYVDHATTADAMACQAAYFPTSKIMYTQDCTLLYFLGVSLSVTKAASWYDGFFAPTVKKSYLISNTGATTPPHPVW
jgi:hypothetical protein